MKPVNTKEKRIREVRRMLKRQRQIWKEIRNLGLIELKKPIKHGWYKEIVITNRIELYKNQTTILEVYDKIEKYVWGKTKEKAHYKWQEQTSRYFIYKDVPTLSKRQYNKLSYAAQCLCVPFQFYTERKKLRTRFYLKIPKSAYKIKLTRAYITHRKRIDPNLLSELDFISKQLNKKGYYNINQAFYPWKDYWNLKPYKQEKLKTKKHLKELKKIKVQKLIEDDY